MTDTVALEGKIKKQSSTPAKSIHLEASWLQRLGDEFEKDYMQQLKLFLQEEKKAGKVIYPSGDEIFNAFALTPFEKVKLVILGQDPYHGPDQAHGLCFSVPHGIRPPPSLVNIFKELNQDLQIPISQHGFLEHWADQGVLLLNSVLSVQQGQAASHQQRGWEQFTDRVIALLDQEREGIVFLLWGSYAQKKGKLIDRSKHLVLHAPHPSPLSAYRGFLGCQHFSKANEYLDSRAGPIDWQLPA